MVGLTKDSQNCLQLLRDMLPLNNEMLLSMYEAKKTFSALCGKSRWKINNEGGKIKKGVPAKDKEFDGNYAIDQTPQRPRQPGKNIDVYLSPLVDDLKTLWEKGVETYNAHLRKTKDGLNARLDLVEMGLRNLVSLEELKLFGLKSHDYHALMQQLLPVALRSVLPKHVRLCGPVYFRWMYPFERYMKVLKGYVRNHNRPEGCIAECYLAEEAVEFCTEYLSGTHAIGIPKSNNYDNKFGRPITGGHSTNIDHKSWLQAHHYVLENTTIVQPYIEEHMNWLKSHTLDNLRDKFGYKKNICVVLHIGLKERLKRLSIMGKIFPTRLGASQAKQVFYVEGQLDPKWSIVLSIRPKDFNNMEGLDDFTDIAWNITPL
ncbi:hypothetical protein CK203_064202 [Vitis vinifera]|uniref:DUF4218 domain-containing protein n=1 Tax=Vitis vinifera TaxID=29760 RepID=A0A438G6Y6_VITVI|nr:hypothetical protein CK203_064202 [Vitis vinifera]